VSFNETKRNQAKPSKAKQSQAKPSKAKQSQAKPSETRRFEVHQLLAFHTTDFAVGLSENAPRSPGATFPRCVNRSQSRLIEADRSRLKPIDDNRVRPLAHPNKSKAHDRISNY
jgi:hypothetical protein